MSCEPYECQPCGMNEFLASTRSMVLRKPPMSEVPAIRDESLALNGSLMLQCKVRMFNSSAKMESSMLEGRAAGIDLTAVTVTKRAAPVEKPKLLQ